MGFEYSKNETYNFLIESGLQVIGEIKTTKDKVLCLTEEGYKVLAIPESMRNRNDKPVVFSKYNPYTIENIKKYLVINCIV